jgi:hypothetical protein
MAAVAPLRRASVSDKDPSKGTSRDNDEALEDAFPSEAPKRWELGTDAKRSLKDAKQSLKAAKRSLKDAKRSLNDYVKCPGIIMTDVP